MPAGGQLNVTFKKAPKDKGEKAATALTVLRAAKTHRTSIYP
jgi:hypothetical protein